MNREYAVILARSAGVRESERSYGDYKWSMTDEMLERLCRMAYQAGVAAAQREEDKA